MRQFIFITVSASLLCALPLFEALNADEKLQACCGHLPQADASCKAYFCNFNTLSSNTILGFLASCSGKGQTVGPIWDCASSRKDHTACCQKKGVQANCMAFCAVANGLSASPFTYLTCLSAFEAVKQCFREHLQTNPNLYGDQ